MKVFDINLFHRFLLHLNHVILFTAPSNSSLIMKSKLSELSTPELRSLFVKESRKFAKTLDTDARNLNEEHKNKMLTELRDYLKEIRKLIEHKEQEEKKKSDLK
jgi:hypothetical protein